MESWQERVRLIHDVMTNMEGELELIRERVGEEEFLAHLQTIAREWRDSPDLQGDLYG